MSSVAVKLRFPTKIFFIRLVRFATIANCRGDQQPKISPGDTMLRGWAVTVPQQTCWNRQHHATAIVSGGCVGEAAFEGTRTLSRYGGTLKFGDVDSLGNFESER